jgi:hypothetical protein
MSSIVQGQTTSFKYNLYKGGIFNLSTDSIYMALYTGNADLNSTTTSYSSANEIVGSGYTAGGQIMTGISINFDVNSGVAYINWNNVVWSPAAFTTRCALIYDQTASNGSIAVIDFGADKTCSNSFTVTMPANAYNTALIRSS